MPDPSLILGPACFLYATRIDAYAYFPFAWRKVLEFHSIAEFLDNIFLRYQIDSSFMKGARSMKYSAIGCANTLRLAPYAIPR